MSKIGVNIDLSVFFEDERKMVLVMVDPEWKSVECLQKRIQFLFDVDLVRFLNSDGCFLPPQEPIEIIKFCKGLKAFVPKETLEKIRKKKKSKKAKKDNDKSSLESDSGDTSTCNNEANDTSQKKRKYYSLQSGVSSASLQSAKRLKNCIDVKTKKIKEINKSSEISSTSEQMQPPPLVKGKKSYVEKSKSSPVISDNEESDRESKVNSCQLSAAKITVENDAENSFLQEENYSKRRRTSTPKEKEISEIVDNVRKTIDEERPSNLHSSTLLNASKIVDSTISKKSIHSTPNRNNPFKGNSLNTNKSHIYFNESDVTVSTVTEASKSSTISENETIKPQSITIFRCPLNDVSNGSQKPRIFQINSLTKSPKKPLLEIQEEIVIKPILLENNLSESLKQTENSSQIQATDVLENNANDSLTAINQDNSSLNDKTTTEGNSELMSMENTDTTKTTTTIAVANDHDDHETSKENLKLIDKAKEPDDPTKIEFKELIVLSFDGVSIVIDDDDDVSKTKKKTLVNSKEQSHDLTEDDPDDDSSDVEEISDIIDLNETEDNCDSTVNTSPTKNFYNSKIVIRKVLPFCVDMLDLPNVGDIIIFKVPYVNKNLKSVETNFIAGIAEYINKRTKTIKLLVKDGIEELFNIPNKFICNLNESQDHVKYLQLKISDMLQPKICSRN